jgi:hypothetical protein
MQRFSQGASLLLAQMGAVAPAGSVDIERLIDEWIQVQSRQAQGNWLLWFVVIQLLAIVSYWIASNVVTRERTTFANAAKLWGLLLVGGLSIGFLGGLVSAIGIALNAPIIVALALCASAVFILIILVTLPMRVYGISLIRAVGFVGITLVLLVAAQLAFTPLLPLPALDPQHEAVLYKLANLSDPQREQFFRGIWARATRGQLNPTASAEAIVADRSKSIEERHVALKGMFDDLEKRRAALTWGDAGALADYNRRNARYQELLKQLQEEALAPGRSKQ